MDRGGPGGLLEPIKDPGGTPKQAPKSPQMNKKMEKCEFCMVDLYR